jgi:hypothetical protein
MSTLEQQKVSFESIKSLCTNYKKDSGSRKTQEYLNKRLTTLADQWEDFKTRHNVLERELEDRSIEYFTEDVYGKTQAMFDATKQDILNLLRSQKLEKEKKVEFSLTDYAEDVHSDDVKLRELLNKQERNFKAIDRAMSKVDDAVTQKWELEDHLSVLKSKWEPIDKIHWELDAVLKGENENYYGLFVNIEHKYDELKRRLNSKIWSVAHYQHSAPRVEVPEFTGNYSQWISFKDLFLETIHNNPTINKAQKMQHLKTKLRGEAERLVQHLTINAENYSSCWDILNQRYDNKRLQFTSYINAMLNLSFSHHPDAHSFKRMHDVIMECINGLANIGIEITTWDPIIVHMMSQKLDSSSYNDYLKEIQNPRELPILSDFLSFLESRFMAYEAMKHRKKEVTTTTFNYQKPSNNSTFNKTSFTKQYPARKSFNYKPELPRSYHTVYGNCTLCDGNHVLMQCPKFIDLDPVQRNITISKLHVCKNCLYSHGNNECKSTKTCKECNMRHHTLLHNPAKKSVSQTCTKNITNQRPSTSTMRPTSNHLSAKETEILLTTVQLKVQSFDGTYVTLRCLLDQGSQVNLLSENAAQLLKLPRHKLNAVISGIGASSKDCKGRVQLRCMSMYSDYTFETQALIMNKITNNLPNSTFKRNYWPHLENLKLADPDYNVSRSVDLLLGADVYAKIILDGVLRGDQGSPIAQQTHLGWILCGKLETLNCHITILNLDDITKFWETEDITPDSTDANQDDHCETHYRQTVQRASDGKYIVQMPFHPNYEEKLGNSKSIAISQFLQLEKRLQRQSKLAQMYRDFMKEYADLGHMKLSPPAASLEYFLPHHGVLRNSTTTKLRVVYNGSQKSTSGQSLNSIQFKGPNLQKDIQGLLMKWRTYRYAYTADVAMMYRCIWISEEQHPLQKIVWRNSPDEKLKEYNLCTVSYGTKSAPWLAMRTLKQLAMDDGHKYPEAAKVLLNEFYMDDLISGHHSLEAAKELQTTLIQLLKGGGMNLRKWSVSDPTLLKNLNENQISTTNVFDFKDEQSTKTLGLSWNHSSDTFTFSWDLNSKKVNRLTKRVLLSEISKLYDPIGFWAPITVTAKLLFQKVWLNKQTSWDDELPKDIQDSWIRFKRELPQIKTIKLQRWVGTIENTIELYGFCDASEKAYSCVVYTKTTNGQGETTTILVAAKTRVAPLANKRSLPKLELAGALLLSQLIKKIKEALAGYNVITHAWCDSQVVLAWLQGDNSRWEKYVANRVTKVTEIIPHEQWKYIKSEKNPADSASRGLYPEKLTNFKLWWHGPELIRLFDNETQQKILPIFTTNICVVNNLQTRTITQQNEYVTNELLHKYSSLTRVIRITAWLLRFRTALSKKKHDTAYLTTSELAEANELIIKHAQRVDFEQEYKLLTKKKLVTKQSKLFKLNPYLDDKQIIRLGGRLNKSDLPSTMKNPVILPNKGRLTQLIIDQAHTMTLHGGARLTLFYIRQRYWIIGGNRAVKLRLQKCVPCHRFNPTENFQLMADLPKHRTTPSRPFTHTGVDYTGNVEIKLNKGRGVKTSKGYIAIFVCMTTKAVHIELVSDLSAETFLAAFQRLCSRRGVPKHVYSDCGTNFIKAAKSLKNEYEEFQLLLPPEFFNEMGKLEVQWHFNAPAWPTAGGIWERAVRSMKHHLRRVLGDQKLTYEEFSTLLTKIEACMNSRPLCPLTEDPEEFYNCLTPSHFLTGSPTLSLPLSDYKEATTIDLRRRWQLIEHMQQHFWKNWSNEYLSQLQNRSKWNKPTKNIKQGDVVLVKDNNLPPGKWAMGRVLETHPGTDGYVRVTTIKTQSGITKRPVTKLSPLPIEPEDIQQPTNMESTSILKKAAANQNKITKRTLMAIFTSLTIMCGMISGSRASSTTAAQITAFEPERPVYYDTMGKLQLIHDEWTLLMYYNLSSYWQTVDRVENYLDGIKDLCQKTDPRYCQTTMQQLYHEMDLLNYYNSLLLTPHKHLSARKKRGLIDGVGYVANSLFGILDQRFADKYQKDIKAVKNNENYLLELIQNQTSIVELENTVLKKSEENIKRQFNVIEDFMNNTNANLAKVGSTLEIVMATSYFNSASLAAYLLINNVRSVQEMLFNTLTDIYKGHIDVHLVTPVNLIKQLSAISGRLPRTLSLPIENIKEDIKDLYKLLYVKARVTDSYFLFEIHIPLISDEDFAFYQAIPLPTKYISETIMVKTTSKYIGVNFRKNIYVSLTEELLKQCIQQKPDSFVCNKNLPVYNLNNNNVPCEAKLLGHRYVTPCDVRSTSCKDEWIELHAVNTWLAICCDTCSLRTICENEVTAHTMTSSGIVTLPQGCVLQASHLTIHSHNQFNSKIRIDYNINVPAVNTSVNRIVNLTSYKMTPNTLNLMEEAEIVNRITTQHRNEQALPASVSSHDIHQYAISYLLLGAALVTFTVWAVKRRFPKLCAKRTSQSQCSLQSVKGHYEDIEMQPLPPMKKPKPTTSRAEDHHRAANDNVTFNLD